MSIATKRRGKTETFRAAGASVAEVLQWFRLNNPMRSKCRPAEKECHRLYGLFEAALGQIPCVDCRPHHLLTFINDGTDPDAAWTRRRWNATLQRPFNFAAQLGLFAANPFKGLTFPGGKHGRNWMENEYHALLRAAAPPFRRVLVMIPLSGMRPGEVAGLMWKHVRLEARAIVLDEHKNAWRGKPRVRLANLLGERRIRGGNGTASTHENLSDERALRQWEDQKCVARSSTSRAILAAGGGGINPFAAEMILIRTIRS